VNLGITDVGEGKPLLLVHGVATNRAIWQPALPLLAEGRRAVAIDVPGFGTSDPAGEGFDLEHVAGAILDRLGSEGVEPPLDVLGQSLGGAIGLVLAAHHAGAIDRLILAAPAGLGAWPAALADVIAAGTTGFLALRRIVGPALAESTLARRAMFLGAIHDAGSLKPERAQAMIAASGKAVRTREAMETIVAADLRPELRAMRAPLGLIWGANDGTVPIGVADEIRSIRPDAPLEVIPRVAHIPQVENPIAFASAVDRLLDQLPPGPR
jgi:3-oxoadipate enol-lactonase